MRAFVHAGIILILVFVFACSNNKGSMNRKASYKVFSNERGEWNYDIYVNNSLFIRQNYLPAVKGNYVIKNSEEATKLAELIINKIEQGKNPAITIDELKEIHILSE